MRTAFVIAVAAVVAYPGLASVPSNVARAVAATSRPASDTSTDVNRKPAETLAFAGVKPGMTVGEFFPGGGYFTRMLSDVVGPAGHVYGVENAGWKGAVKADQELLANARLANVSIEALPFGTVSFPKPLDLIWVTQNYHDLKIAEFGTVDTAAFNRSVFAALKPGGIYFVLDHDAPAGSDVAAITRLHRIEKSQVIREVTAAGFKLVDQGRFLARADDDHTRPIFDLKGKTDQYALRFVKPRRQPAAAPRSRLTNNP